MMSRRRWLSVLLVSGLGLLSTQLTQAQEQDQIIAFYLKMKEFASKLPGLNREGVVLPKNLILQRLQNSVKSESLIIEDIQLTPEKGIVFLRSDKGIAAKHQLEFQFLPVDWPNRTVHISFKQSSQAVSENVLVRILGNMAIGAVSLATGDQVMRDLVEKMPYARIQGQLLSIRLDQVPSLAPTLNSQLFGYNAFDYVGISELKTGQDAIYVKLAMRKP